MINKSNFYEKKINFGIRVLQKKIKTDNAKSNSAITNLNKPAIILAAPTEISTTRPVRLPMQIIEIQATYVFQLPIGPYR
jgi:hypothetical protein